MTDKRPVGRPSEYDEGKLSKLNYYIETHETFNDPVPTVEAACYELGISKQCFYEWTSAHPEFGDAAERLKLKQGRLLQAGGLNGKFQQPTTKLMLSANHGMREKTEQDITSGGKPLTIVTKVPDGGGDSV